MPISPESLIWDIAMPSIQVRRRNRFLQSILIELRRDKLIVCSFLFNVIIFPISHFAI